MCKKKVSIFIVGISILLLIFISGCSSPTNEKNVDTTVPHGTWVAQTTDGCTSTIMVKENGDWIMVETNGSTTQAKGTSTWKDGEGTIVQSYYRNSPSSSWISYSSTFTGETGYLSETSQFYMIAHNSTYILTTYSNALPLATGLCVTVNSPTSLTLTWDENECASKYRVYYAKYMSIGSQVSRVVQGTSFTATDLPTNTRIYFEVQSIIDDDWSTELTNPVSGIPQ